MVMVFESKTKRTKAHYRLVNIGFQGIMKRPKDGFVRGKVKEIHPTSGKTMKSQFYEQHVSRQGSFTRG